jgi:hypothetical protein
VLDLASQVVAGAQSRYDQARAIETFLRTYTYTLDLPLPPIDHDLVDYFLFEVQEGYCDYYASAMIIMARAVGIPARLASGYAQGTYDHAKDHWVVTQKDSHSWVEVYFVGIGWVEFEPTAGLPALVRPGSDLPQSVVPPKPPRTPGSSGVPWALIVMGIAFLILLSTLIWTWRTSQQKDLAPADLVRDRHTRLVRWGTGLGHPLHDGLTSLEYSEELQETLRHRGHASRWLRAQRAGTEAPTQVETLTDSFNRAQYAPGPITHRESWHIRDLWFRLRRHLWWLWLARH